MSPGYFGYFSVFPLPPRSSRGQMRTLGSMQARHHGARVGLWALVRGSHGVTGSGRFSGIYESHQGLMRELGTVWYFPGASSAPTKLHRQWPQMQLHLIVSASCCDRSKRSVRASTLEQCQEPQAVRDRNSDCHDATFTFNPQVHGKDTIETLCTHEAGTLPSLKDLDGRLEKSTPEIKASCRHS